MTLLQLIKKTTKDHIIREGYKDHKSDSCGKTFFTSTFKNLVENHFQQNNNIFIVHEGRKDYTCNSCGKIFFRENSLKIHIHNEYKHQKCDSCEKTF